MGQNRTIIFIVTLIRSLNVSDIYKNLKYFMLYLINECRM